MGSEMCIRDRFDPKTGENLTLEADSAGTTPDNAMAAADEARHAQDDVHQSPEG